MRKYLHLDIDAFYASVEQLDHPQLRGKPVIVGGTGSRGVVATCSYEARAYGVRSAMPVTVARRKCPDGIFVPGRFWRYEEKSCEIRAVYSAYSECYQPIALDEAYVDVSHYPNAVPIAREIKQRIGQEVGLTCSIGLSYNMSMAKIASDLKKPDAFVVIHPEDALDILRPLPVGTLHGIGRKSQEMLVKRGIHTVEDFWSLSEAEVTHLFGKMGHALYDRARGIDHREIETDRLIKSMSRETTLVYDLYEREQVEEVANELLQELQQDIKQEAVTPQTMTVKIKSKDFTLRSKQRKVETEASWQSVLSELLDEFDFSLGVRLVGIGFSNFLTQDDHQERYEQLSLFRDFLR